MIKQRVYIISTYLMFGRGLTSLLRQAQNIEVAGQEADVELAIEQIRELRPDVVILDSDEPSIEPALKLLGRILKEGAEIRVIGLSLQNNQLHIYSVRQRPANSVNDLLNAIRREPQPDTVPDHQLQTAN